MKNILIVDDEPLVRLALRAMSDLEDYGFIIKAEAENGSQALEILKTESIDIVISDINMPVMNGLELIREIKNQNLCDKIIVLSVYNEYSYLRAAFKLGVSDYVLKNDMDFKHIISLLQRMFDDAEPEKIENVIPSIEAADKEKLIIRLLKKESVSRTELDNCKINLLSNNMLMISIIVEDFSSVEKNYKGKGLDTFVYSVKNSLSQVMSRVHFKEIVAVSPESYIILLSFPNVSLGNVRECILQIITEMRYVMKTYLNLDISVIVSEMANSYDKLNKLFLDCSQASNLRLIYKKGRTIFPEDMEVISIESSNFNYHKKRLSEQLSLFKFDDALNSLDLLLKEISLYSSNKTIDNLIPLYLQIIIVLIQFIHEQQEDITDIFGINVDFKSVLSRFTKHDEVTIWFNNMMQWMINHFASKKNISHDLEDDEIHKALKFIKENYKEQLTLRMISEYVGLSETYFSKLFTKKVGTSFIDYLTHIRIENAKKLLGSTKLKIYEVSERVGFLNVEHFSRVFKKTTGQSPNSYHG